MKTELWLDLEGTIIPHWSQMNIYINHDKMDAIIAEHKPWRLGIYSYAVWCAENYKHFIASELHETLMDKLDGGLAIRTTEQMGMDWFSLHRHQAVDISSNSIWQMPKEFAFLMTVRRLVEHGSDTKKFILFDDTVPHNKTYVINDDVTVLFLNPDA